MTKIIAEIGINHFGCNKKAKSLVDAAHSAGVDSIKLQYRSHNKFGFTSDLEMGSTLVSDEVASSNLSLEGSVEVMTYARSLGMAAGISFFRIFDMYEFQHFELIDFIKIPSAECLNFELIRVAQSLCPQVMVSTGGTSYDDLCALKDSVDFRDSDVVFYCVSNYPTALGASVINAIDEFKSLFPCQIGYSSHDAMWEVCVGFLTKGVSHIERHICLDKTAKGLDISSSSEPEEFERLVALASNSDWTNGFDINDHKPNQGEVQNIKDLGSGYYAKRSLEAGCIGSLDDFEIQSPCRGVKAGSVAFPITIHETLVEGAPLAPSHLKKISRSTRIDHKAIDSLDLSLPVRFHDFKEIDDTFSILNYEFHLSYGDVKRLDEGLRLVQSCQAFREKKYSLHLPDYISKDSLIDPISPDSKIKMGSRKIIDECMEFARRLAGLTGHPVPVVGSFSQIRPDRRRESYQELADYIRVKSNSSAFICPQFLPVKAWYFGGSYEIDAFNDMGDFSYFSMFENGLCIDFAHAIMACNSRNGELSEWMDALLPLATHIHISDAIGEDGEGVEFGRGQVTPYLNRILKKKNTRKVVEQWEGHLNGFQGFRDGLNYLVLER